MFFKLYSQQESIGMIWLCLGYFIIYIYLSISCIYEGCERDQNTSSKANFEVMLRSFSKKNIYIYNKINIKNIYI